MGLWFPSIVELWSGPMVVRNICIMVILVMVYILFDAGGDDGYQ